MRAPWFPVGIGKGGGLAGVRPPSKGAGGWGAGFHALRPSHFLPVLALLASFTFLTPLTARAQLLDSINLFLQEPPRLIVKLDIRGSFITSEPVKFYGLKVGWEHANRFQYGFGYSTILKPVHRNRQVHEAGAYREVDTRLRMGHVSAYADYAFYQRGHWEVRMPVQVGLGHGRVVYDDLTNETRTWQKTWYVLYEPAMSVQYRFLTYFAVTAGFGYRLVFRTSASLGEQLTAPIYMLGLRVFTGDLRRDLKE